MLHIFSQFTHKTMEPPPSSLPVAGDLFDMFFFHQIICPTTFMFVLTQNIVKPIKHVVKPPNNVVKPSKNIVKPCKT